MQWASTVAEEEALEIAVERAASTIGERLDGARPDLVMAFASTHHREHYGQTAALLKQHFPDSVVIGCSAGGVIGDGREIEQHPGLSLTAAVLPNTTLTPFHLEAGQLPIADEKAESWRKLVRVGADREPQFLLFADPFSFDTEPLLLGLDRAYPHSPKIGGLASGATSFGHHALFLDQLVYRSGLVGLALAGDIVLDTVVAQGCRPIGEPLFVTRAETNRIFTLDGKPPLIVLRELHEQASEEERKLFRHSLFLGIAMRDRRDIYQQGDFLIRNIAGIDAERNALVVSTALAPNSVVQFHLRDARTSAADLETLLGRFDALPATARPRGSLLFSCVGRGERLYGEANHDSRIFARHLGATPLGGFFCNGEIGPVHGMTFLHGYTSAFGLFRPRRVT